MTYVDLQNEKENFFKISILGIWQDGPEGNSWLLGSIRVVLRKYIPKNWNPRSQLSISRHTTCKIC